MSDGFKRYRVVNSLLDGSVTYQTSLSTAKVYHSIKNGATFLEDIAQEVALTPGEVSLALKELIDMGAILEDDDDLPDSFLGVKSQPLSEEKKYNFSMSSLPDLFAVNKDNLEMARQEKNNVARSKINYLGSNLGAILSDDNLMAMATSYVPNEMVAQASQGVSTQQTSSAGQPSPEEVAAFMQQLAMMQQKK